MSEKNKIHKFFGWFVIIVIALITLKVILNAVGFVFSVVSSILLWTLPFVGLFFVGYVVYFVFLKEKK